MINLELELKSTQPLGRYLSQKYCMYYTMYKMHIWFCQDTCPIQRDISAHLRKFQSKFTIRTNHKWNYGPEYFQNISGT